MNNKEEIKKIALVTGGNKGIGFEICKQLAKNNIHVILTARDAKKGRAAFNKLKSTGLDLSFLKLDVNKESDIKKCTETIKKKYGRLDILINNAGILIDRKDNGNVSVFHTKIKTISKTLETNTFGPLLLCNYLIPIMKKNKYGRIVNISSGMGQLYEMNGSYPGYRLSKVSLNALTRIYADELKGQNILINTMCPGWVRTDMGGADATRSVEKGAETAIWLSTLPNKGPSGKFFRDKKVIPW